MNLKSVLKIIVLTSLIFGCEEIPSGIIEPKNVDYLVESITAPELFIYSTDNDVLTTSIKISNAEVVKTVWFDIFTIDGVERISSANVMTNLEFGVTRTYVGTANFDENILSGEYEIVYYVEDNIRTSDENISKVGSKKFKLQSEAENIPPVISNLIIPSEINRGVQFAFSILVNDPNGLNDVDSVYYQLKDPNGNLLTNSQGISKFPMFDDGLQDQNSDVTAGDGTYSVYLTFPSSVSTGNWSFEFNANDKSGALSNTLNHIINVK